MKETLKIKYRPLCKDANLFYKIIDWFHQSAIANPKMTKNEKYKKIEMYKELEPKLYQAMIEDIANGLL